MALSTTDRPVPTPDMTPTAGVMTLETMPPGSTAGVGTVPLAGIGMLPGTEAGMTAIKPLGPLRPILYDDIDPILLARLYPGASDPRAAAMEAAEARIVAGEAVEASQYEPIFYEGDGLSAEERDERRQRARPPQPARSGENNPPVVTGPRAPGPGIHTPPQQSQPGQQLAYQPSRQPSPDPFATR
jgi:hypothetical protein